MEDNNQCQLPEKYMMVDVPEVSDERGNLCIAESQHLPFTPRRVFWIYDVGEGKTRGGHAHASCAEIVFPVAGSFDIFVDDGNHQEEIHLDAANRGIYIGPNVWCLLHNFAPGTVCVVLASEDYAHDGYIHHYEEFKRRHRFEV